MPYSELFSHTEKINQDLTETNNKEIEIYTAINGEAKKTTVYITVNGEAKKATNIQWYNNRYPL